MKTRPTDPGTRLFLVSRESGGSSRSLSTPGDIRPTIAGKTLPMRPGFFAADRRLNQPATSAKHVSVRSQPARTAEPARVPGKSFLRKTASPRLDAEVVATQKVAGKKPLADRKKGSQASPPAAPAPGTQPAVGKKARVVRRKANVAKDPRHPAKTSSSAQSRRKPKAVAVAGQTSKKDTVLALLRRPRGATLKEIMQATGWQSHSVRGFLSGALRKKMGLKVKSGKRGNGERVYSVRS
jgi:Protein of unknown function (DUF3489)